MGRCLVINSSPNEVRVALLENGAPVEVHVERRAERGVVGNIYRGRVVRVLPGMQAAFVDIGIERTGFLYVDDALPRPLQDAVADAVAEKGLDEGDASAGPSRQAVATPSADALARGDADYQPGSGKGLPGGEEPASDREGAMTGNGRGFRSAPSANIADLLKQGQDILVQVQKEPLGAKGARLTRHVTLPGHHLVLMPFSRHIGVSHRITDEVERERLKDILAGHLGEGVGCIVRTAAEGCDAGPLRREALMLKQVWEDVSERGASGPSPQLIFEDLDLVLRATRDFFTEDVEKIVCDDEDDFRRVEEFMRGFAPESVGRVELYRGTAPIFDQYGIEVELERALDRRVWLKSGGYIIIDQAEALTAIDVNSGRFVGKNSLEDTITQINLEAVRELACQLRLRNIGGIIIIDFIDMTSGENRNKVLAALEEALSHDRAKSTVVRMSEIGLVEMTRKRVRDSLGHLLTEACPYCKARGFIKSEVTVANEVLRAIVRTLARSPAKRVLVNMQAEVADYLYDAESEQIERIETQHATQVIPVARQGFHREHYDIVVVNDFDID